MPHDFLYRLGRKRCAMVERLLYWFKGLLMPSRGCRGCCLNCKFYKQCKVEMGSSEMLL